MSSTPPSTLWRLFSSSLPSPVVCSGESSRELCPLPAEEAAARRSRNASFARRDVAGVSKSRASASKSDVSLASSLPRRVPCTVLFAIAAASLDASWRSHNISTVGNAPANMLETGVPPDVSRVSTDAPRDPIRPFTRPTCPWNAAMCTADHPRLHTSFTPKPHSSKASAIAPAKPGAFTKLGACASRCSAVIPVRSLRTRSNCLSGHSTICCSAFWKLPVCSNAHNDVSIGSRFAESM
mmetsp:Transcript_64090/g.133638  ORF Transcript_64090/g.133638 Transcript_64090/m.133638 type:complete len:239 (-) Transcript_64090:4338-5054(-)